MSLLFTNNVGFFNLLSFSSEQTILLLTYYSLLFLINTYYRGNCQEASTLSLQKNCTVRINKKNYFNNIIEFNNKIDNKNKSTKNN